MVDNNNTSISVQMGSSKPLKLLSVKDVLNLGKTFYVPAYQRGYRWRPKEVKLFIEDLEQFRKEEGDKAKNEKCPFYCLQAVVVKEIDNNMLEVIDGQQRLTTVLILLQALYTIKEETSLKAKMMLESQKVSCDIIDTPIISKDVYSIKYEHRKNSEVWLEEITKGYFSDKINGNPQKLDHLKGLNSDYYHLVDVYSTAVDYFRDWEDGRRANFKDCLKEETRFIWYDITSDDSNDTEVDIFDRINATKIALNNAELIKALLLQKNNFGSETQQREQLAIDWDNIEKRLQEPSFWGFVYSTRHPYEYETHIEYIFDLLKNKSKDDGDEYYFTFNQYYKEFLGKQDKRLSFVKDCWNEVLETMLLLEEWYNERTCYHYIGYLLEYGKEIGSDNAISIPYLKSMLTGIDKEQRTAKLKKLIRQSLKNIESKQLFHGQSGNKLTQILFLLNIQSEQNRKSDTARFSFSSYKQIKKNPGWNEEHVASNVDYSPDAKDREGLAYALFEYFTGVRKGEEDCQGYEKKVRAHYPIEKEAQELCDKLWKFITLDEKANDFDNKLSAIYDEIMVFFDAKNDGFKENVSIIGTRSKKREKDFIWNFALLNATTNKSYGNSIYPLKRRRIMSDENDVYTPICTRALFEKAYSCKLTNLMVWSRKDAKDYWDYICSCLSEFLPSHFHLPFKY